MSDATALSTSYPTTVYPYDCACYITVTIGQSSFQGSGVIIGPHTILTASHVLWDATTRLSASAISISPGYSQGGATISGPWSDHFFEVANNNDQLSESASQSDFAIIDVAADLSSYGAFGIDPNYQGSSVSVTGYPATAHGAQTNQTGTVSLNSQYSTFDYGTVSVSPGNSGGPLWINEGTSAAPLPYVVGVVSTSAWASQITSSDLQTIDNWEASDENLLNSGSLLAITSSGGVTSQPVQLISGSVDSGAGGETVTLINAAGVLIGSGKVQADGDWSIAVTLGGGSSLITPELTGVDNVMTGNPVSFTLSSASPSSGILESLTPAEEIAGIYIGYFDRGPDAAGFSFWKAQYSQALSGGQSTDQSLKNIANSFAPQSETLALYPFLATSLNPNSAADVTGVHNLIDSVYENLFGRTPGAKDSGVQYWAGQILTGQVGLGQAILDIANGATGADAATVLNKVVVASYLAAEEFALGLGTTTPVPAGLLSQLHSVLASVTSNPSTVSTAEAISLTGSAIMTTASKSSAAAMTVAASEEVHPTGISAANHANHEMHLVA
jgi:V8-like Glu-specific endopeptidase